MVAGPQHGCLTLPAATKTAATIWCDRGFSDSYTRLRNALTDCCRTGGSKWSMAPRRDVPPPGSICLTSLKCLATFLLPLRRVENRTGNKLWLVSSGG